jgi:hypothetical protein
VRGNSRKNIKGQVMQSEKLSVLQFLTIFGIGGTERQVLNLVKGLDTARFGVKVACLKTLGPHTGTL